MKRDPCTTRDTKASRRTPRSIDRTTHHPLTSQARSLDDAGQFILPGHRSLHRGEPQRPLSARAKPFALSMQHLLAAPAVHLMLPEHVPTRGAKTRRTLCAKASLLAIALLVPLTGARADDVRFAPVHQVLGTIESPRALEVGDLDGDGDLDLVSVSGETGHVVWYENVDGEGLFVEKELLNGEVGPTLGLALGLGDLDGDSDLDVLASTTVFYSWYTNRGVASGFFGPALPVSAQLGYHCFALVPADLDGDGDLDMAYGTTIEVGWYRNRDGLGTFEGPIPLESNLFYNESLVAADVNGDTRLDLLVASKVEGTVGLFVSLGSGRFEPRQVIASGMVGVRCIAAADIDGDDDPDVLFASYLGDRVGWLPNRDGKGGFGSQQSIGTGLMGALSVVAADLDRDGDLDVIAASADDNSVSWFENLDGKGFFSARRVLVSTAAGVSAVRAADLDGDGDVDVVFAATGDDEILWLENRVVK